MSGDDASRRHVWLAEAVSSVLLLLGPFLGFLRYHQYPFLTLECVVVCATLVTVAVGLFAMMRRGGGWRVLGLTVAVAAFIDLQFDLEKVVSFKWMIVVPILALLTARQAPRILAPATLAFVLSALVLPVQTTALSRWHAEEQTAPIDTSLPPVFHIVLDELASPEHLDHTVDDRQAGRLLETVLLDHGFRIVRSAVARYSHTQQSLASVLNDTVLDNASALTIGHRPAGTSPPEYWPPFRLSENLYFRSLAARGYHLSVYQSDFLDFCHSADAPVEQCVTYPGNTARRIHVLDVSLGRKISLLLVYYLQTRSHFYAKIEDAYRMGSMAAAQRMGLHFPSWPRKAPKLLPSFRRVASYVMHDTVGGLRGRVFFIHAMDPHYPYVRDENCAIAPESQWLEADEPAAAPDRNTPESRMSRYDFYAQQVACLAIEMEEFFTWVEARPDAGGAIVVIHGDHGSRIAVHPPTAEALEGLNEDDAGDYFLTLFAVGAPGLVPDVVDDATPLEVLVRRLLLSEFSSIDVPAYDTVTVFVDGRGTQLVPVLLRKVTNPASGDGSRLAVVDPPG